MGTRYHKGDVVGTIKKNTTMKNKLFILVNFPEGLITRVMLACSNENDVVNAHGGWYCRSGSESAQPKLLGAEKDAKYVTIANRHWSS